MLYLRNTLLHQKVLLSTQLARYTKALISESTVPLFGKLIVDCKSSLRIRSLNPQQCPENDKLRFFGRLEPKVTFDGNVVTVKVPKDSKGAYEIEVPFQYEVYVNHDESGDTTVENVEIQRININNNAGSIQMRNIKASVVKAVAKKNIHAAKHLQGDIMLKSNNGNIMTDRIQGTKVEIHCPKGKVDLQAVYCDSCSIIGSNSSVRTGTTKGNVSIEIEDEGKVEVGDVNGSLEVQMRSGDVKFHVSQRSMVDVDIAEGDISLTVSPQCPLLFDLSALTIEVDDNLEVSEESRMELPDCHRYTGSLNEEKDAVCRLQTREGTINVRSKNWYETLDIQ